MKKIFLIIGTLVLLSGCQKQVTVMVDNDLSDQISTSTISTSTTTTVPASSTIPKKTVVSSTQSKPQITAVIPDKLILPVAFAQQAPFGNWDAVHEETCEEASMINVAHYYSGEKLDETIMEAELQKLLKWETDHGYKVDITADQTVIILQEYFGLKARVSTEVTIDNIKYELNQKHLIILPTAGQELGNPNFSGLGPIYHMLMVKGYDSRDFIVNDVGTRKGNSYHYAYDTLLNAVHDWQPQFADKMTPTLMDTGRKVMIIVQN